MHPFRTIAAAAAATVLLGTGTAGAMGLDFSWAGTGKCFDKKSPPFTVSGVPKGTKKLRFRMVDLDAPNYPHGGGTVGYSGKGSIPSGAFKYTGPCPPGGQHLYQWTVQALDESGKVIGTAKAKKKFPPK